MATKYKLTTQAMTTYGGCQWEIGVERATSGEGDLCGPGWLHYYHDPLLAVALNPLHADIDAPRLWEVEAGGAHMDDYGLKGGCTRMTLLREIDLPVITTAALVRFAILCAWEVFDDPAWRAWATGWLNGEDRSADAARATEIAARATREAARAATAAAMAATAAAKAGEWAAISAAWAEAAYHPIDMPALIRQAIAEEKE